MERTLLVASTEDKAAGYLVIMKSNGIDLLYTVYPVLVEDGQPVAYILKEHGTTLDHEEAEPIIAGVMSPQGTTTMDYMKHLLGFHEPSDLHTYACLMSALYQEVERMSKTYEWN